MKTAAKIISYLFHPLIMPVIGLFIIFNTNSYINYIVPYESKLATLLFVGVNTFIIPLFLTILLLFTKFISSLEMETQRERTIPYIYTIVLYVVVLYKLRDVQVPPVIFKFIAGAALSIIIAFIVNLKWKISAHMIGVGGLVGMLLCISVLLGIYITPFLILSLFIAGTIGTARLLLKVHTPPQIYIGFFVGIVCQFIVLYF